LIETLEIVKQNNDSIIKEFKLVSLPKKLVDLINVKYKNIGKKFPIKKLKDINGNVITFEDLQARPTLIHFWYTSCRPCIKEMPDLNKILTKYAGKINFIAITFDTRNTIKEFLEINDFSFIQIADKRNLIDKLDVKSYPLNMFLNKEGIIDSVYNPFLKILKYDKPSELNLTIEFSEILDKLL
jgi:cytochrome c biogenesis protein CcmG, thiol:disulfide interchange protein DsbE